MPDPKIAAGVVTPGRIVHYFSGNQNEDPIVAVVTAVIEGTEGCVSLTLMPAGQTPYPSAGAVHWSPTPTPGYWSWPERR